MNEGIYKLYKSGRDLVEMIRHKDLSQELQDFIESLESGSKLLDRAKPEYYDRWKKERNSE